MSMQDTDTRKDNYGFKSLNQTLNYEKFDTYECKSTTQKILKSMKKSGNYECKSIT